MKKTILIVDDDIDTLQLVGTMLEQKGFRILAANSGDKALQIAKNEKFDLVILDVMMPGIDGYEVTRRLRAIDITSLVPIILFSARVQVDDKMVGYEAGADDYLTKPTHPTELISRVNGALEKSKNIQSIETESTQAKSKSTTFGIISTRGGLGTSNLSLNLAIALYQNTKSAVTLTEFRPGQGTIGDLMDHSELNGIIKLIQKPYTEIKTDEIKEQIIKDSSGIHLLLSSNKSKDSIRADYSNHFEAISSKLNNISEYSVIDLGPGLSVTAGKVIKNCDQIVLVTEPFSWTINQTKDIVKSLLALGVASDSLKIILITKYRSQYNLSPTDAQNELGRKIDFIITPSPEDVFVANNRKSPIITLLPDSIYSKQIISISNELIL